MSSTSSVNANMRPPPVFSIFTHSVGAHLAGHLLTSKLKAIARAGYPGVEIFQDDLDAYMQSEEFEAMYRCQTPPDSPAQTYRRLSGVAAGTTTHNVSPRSAAVGTDDSTDGVGAAPSHQASSSSSKEKEKGKTVDENHNDMIAWNAHGRCTPAHYLKEVFCATYIGHLCHSLGLKVMTLQPIRDVEGWTEPSQRDAALARVRSRFAVMRALGTDLMIICSSNASPSDTTGDFDSLANDLTQVADMAVAYNQTVDSPSTQPIRIAYEALSWGTHVDKWSQAWQVVRRVNRDNVGICFDSFNTLARELADPCSVTGLQEPEEEARLALQQSLQGITNVPTEKIFFLQIGDARKMQAPLAPSPNAEEPRPARMIWSRGNRLFPGEQDRGAFLPVTDFVRAVTVGAGYTGPWSAEVFNSSLNDRDTAMQDDHARRGYQGLSWLAHQVYHS